MMFALSNVEQVWYNTFIDYPAQYSLLWTLAKACRCIYALADWIVIGLGNYMSFAQLHYLGKWCLTVYQNIQNKFQWNWCRYFSIQMYMQISSKRITAILFRPQCADCMVLPRNLPIALVNMVPSIRHIFHYLHPRRPVNVKWANK